MPNYDIKGTYKEKILKIKLKNDDITLRAKYLQTYNPFHIKNF